MGNISWIAVGAITGIVAERFMGTRTGIVVATVIGIVRALLEGLLARVLFHIDPLNSFFDLGTWITAIVGAVVLLALRHAVTASGSRTRRARV